MKNSRLIFILTLVAAAEILKWSKGSGSKRYGILQDHIMQWIVLFLFYACKKKKYKTMKKTVEFVNLDIPEEIPE